MTGRVLVAGYYGAGNAGDEWILSGLLLELRRHDPGIEARVLSHNPEATEREHAVEAVGWGNIEALADAVRWSSLVIVGGGGLWQDYWGYDPLDLLSGRASGIAGYGTPILLAHLLDRPCAWLGSGVGPLQAPKARDTVRDLAGICGLVSVRDAGSREGLVACGVDPHRVHLGADLAFLTEPLPSGGTRSSGSPTMAANLRPWPFAGEEHDWEGEIAAALRSWCAGNDGRVVLVPLHESKERVEDDRAIAYRMADAIRMSGRVEVAPPELPWPDRLAVLVNSDLVLGMRYHALVAAMRAGVPCVALAYDPKVRSLMEDLGAVEDVVDLEQVARSGLAYHMERRVTHVAPAAIVALAKRAGASISYALQLDSRLALPPPTIVGEFVVSQSALMAHLEQGLRELTGVAVSIAPRADAGIAALRQASAEARRNEGQLEQLRREADCMEEELLSLSEKAQTAERELHLVRLALEEEQSRASDAAAQLATLRGTAGVRLLDGYWRTLRRLAPEGSRMRTAYLRLRQLLASVRALRHEPQARASQPGQSGRWPAGRVVALPEDHAWFRSLAAFLHRADGPLSGRPVFILAPTRFAQEEGQRSYHVARELALRGRPVVFSHWRWGRDDGSHPAPPMDGVLSLPLDVLLSDPDQSLGSSPESRGLVLLEFPIAASHRFLATANARGWTTVYDAVDDWLAFSRKGQAPWYDAGFERSLGTVCDVMLSVTPALGEIIAERTARRPHILPNAWAPDILTSGNLIQTERGEVTLGYFGHLTESWFDWDLLISCARLRPEWRFHLIGYGGGWRTTRLPPNVIYHGKLQRASLAAHASGWDVGVVPFQEGSIAGVADPIKIYEYLAMDLPVVGSGIRVPGGAEGLVEIASGAKAFVRAVELCLSRRQSTSASRRVFAGASTWSVRVEQLERLLADDPRAVLKQRIFEAE